MFERTSNYLKRSKMHRKGPKMHLIQLGTAQQVPVLLEKGMRDRILKAFRALSYCADTKYYHEHWFQLAELLDRATAALARNGSSLVSGGPSSRNAARLAAAVPGELTVAVGIGGGLLRRHEVLPRALVPARGAA